MPRVDTIGASLDTSKEASNKTDERVLKLVNSYVEPNSYLPNDQLSLFDRFDICRVNIKCDIPANVLFSLERLYAILEMIHSSNPSDFEVLADLLGADISDIEKLSAEIDDSGKRLLMKLRLFFAKKLVAR